MYCTWFKFWQINSITLQVILERPGNWQRREIWTGRPNFRSAKFWQTDDTAVTDATVVAHGDLTVAPHSAHGGMQDPGLQPAVSHAQPATLGHEAEPARVTVQHQEDGVAELEVGMYHRWIRPPRLRVTIMVRLKSKMNI